MPLLSAHTPIGLDIGSRCVHAAQLRRTRRGVVASAWTTLTRPVPGAPMSPDEARRIAGTLDRLGFAGRALVITLPEERTLAAALELPPRSSSAPLHTIARQELARAAKCEAADLELAWWELPGAGRAGEPTHALAVGCRHAEAEPFVSALGDAGLDVTAIDSPLTALARAAAGSAGSPPQLTAVLDLGWQGGHLLLMHGALPVYQRSATELGIARLCQQLATPADAGLAADAEQILRDVGCAAPTGTPDHDWPQAADARAHGAALADEAAEHVRLAFAYAQRRFDAQPSHVLLCGGGANLPGMCARIAQKLDLPVSTLRADAMVRPRGAATEVLGTLSVQAVALAASGAPWAAAALTTRPETPRDQAVAA
ncbi:MAG: hypothetical protein K2Q20_01940 [Phycisphaerales bacterium]|nr:hypothetical protein [Phycisphaerales bacterium]